MPWHGCDPFDNSLCSLWLCIRWNCTFFFFISPLVTMSFFEGWNLHHVCFDIHWINVFDVPVCATILSIVCSHNIRAVPIRFWTKMELDLKFVWEITLFLISWLIYSAVERVVEYLDLPQEPVTIVQSNPLPAYWPSTSNKDYLVRVESLVVKYAPELPEILRGISFNLSAKERIGLLGRTGILPSRILCISLPCLFKEAENPPLLWVFCVSWDVSGPFVSLIDLNHIRLSLPRVESSLTTWIFQLLVYMIWGRAWWVDLIDVCRVSQVSCNDVDKRSLSRK